MNSSLPFDGTDPRRDRGFSSGTEDDPEMESDWDSDPNEHAHRHACDQGTRFMRASKSSVSCPHCGCQHTQVLQRGKRVGSVIGAVAGVAGGVAAGCLRAPQFPYPPLRWLGLVSSAVIGGITGGTAGCASGASLGDMLDDRILHNRRCTGCHKRFTHNDH